MSKMKKYLALLLTIATVINILPAQILAEELIADFSAAVDELPAEDLPTENEIPEQLPEDTETADSPSTPADTEGEETPDTPADTEDVEAPGTPTDTEDTQTPDDSETPDSPELPGEPESPEGAVNTEEPLVPIQEESVTLVNDNSPNSRFANAFYNVLRQKGLTTENVIVQDPADSDSIKLNLDDKNGPKILTLLSQQPQTDDCNYQNWNIFFNVSGTYSFPNHFDDLGDFVGLGDDNFPFAGQFSISSGTMSLISSKTFFKALHATADLSKFSIQWTGASTEPILTDKLFVNTSVSEEVKALMPLNSTSSFSPYIGTLSKPSDLTLSLPVLNYSGANKSNAEYPGNLGLICCTMESNTKLRFSALTLPKTIQLNSSGSTGTLVGFMGSGATLTIAQQLSLDNVSLEGEDAGGLVGTMKKDASLVFEENCGVAMIDVTLNASGSAGGIAGVVETTTGPLKPYQVNSSTSDDVVDSSSGSNGDVMLGFEPDTTEESAVDPEPVTADEPAVDPEPDPADEPAVDPEPDPADEPAPLNFFVRAFKALTNFFTAPFSKNTEEEQPEVYALSDDPVTPTPNQNIVLKKVQVNGTKNAGILYGRCTVTGTLRPFIRVQYADNTSFRDFQLSGSGNCGGLFGTLTLNDSGQCKMSHKVISSLSSATETTSYGGVAGTLDGSGRANALVVIDCFIKSGLNFADDLTNDKYPGYIGGIVAKQSTVTLDASRSSDKDSQIYVEQPKTYAVTNYGFGGLVAQLGDEALLIADNMKISTNSYYGTTGGGGVAGSTGKGSIVYLKNSLDLSACPLDTNAYSGQIVGNQDCSLIYAPGVSISRLDTNYSGMELDDIGSYGELYRIPDFLTVNENYETAFSFEQPLSKNDFGEYVLGSAMDYACLALAWQSQGNFATVKDVGTNNWNTLKSCTILLSADVNLKDCGIGGLSRDIESSDNIFSGTLKGNGRTITLDIGAANSHNTVSKGDGRIYWHKTPGLFSQMSSAATVEKLTLGGSIRISNARSAMKSGGLAAILNCDKGNTDLSLKGVSTTVSFDVGAGSDSALYSGGLFGHITGAKKVTLTLAPFQSSGAPTTSEEPQTETQEETQEETPQTTTTVPSCLAANITVTSNDKNGSMVHIGGAIGYVDATNLTINFDQVTLGGRLEIASMNNIYAGGLIGTIYPQTTNRIVNLTDLTVYGFTMEGTAKERMGGILGGLWADTDVDVTKLTVTNTKLTANGAGDLGGLVYRASGKWTVKGIDLSGLSITANSAKSLGLLVCHGDPYKDPLSTTSSTNMNALYLEMAEHWKWNDTTGTGYKLLETKIYAANAAVFDEFVAYTAYADRSNNTPTYQITHPGAGIISLKTTGTGIVMDKDGTRNTYSNRTEFGKTKQTNPNSRYYYNLPDVMTKIADDFAQTQLDAQLAFVDDPESVDNESLVDVANSLSDDDLSLYAVSVDTAEELLIWSVYRYAYRTLQPYFTCGDDNSIPNMSGITTIGGTASTVSFDMKGLSYYPIDIIDSDVTVQNAKIHFYNEEIEALETDNKSTRSTDTNQSQHYTMHCGLFHNFTSESAASANKTYTMAVNGVSFAGTVGQVNSGSGALICGSVRGDNKGSNVTICKVQLADSDSSGKAVTLDGIAVNSTEIPATSPVLINHIGSYSALSAQFVKTSQKQGKAGSSLIGDVGEGDKAAENVTISFTGTIKLAESGVFTKAILLNSLHYKSGSATYNFKRSKDFDKSGAFVHNATHGQELSIASVEFPGKTGYYDDADSLKPVQKKDDNSDFSGYLPYVANSPATDRETYPLSSNWHELAVNIHFSPLDKGCGTYGDPYRVTPSQLLDAANFINSGNAATGWQVRVPANSEYHTSDSGDILLTYQDGKWLRSDNNTEYTGAYKDIHNHLTSAYYQLECEKDAKTGTDQTFELPNFGGIGSKEHPFSGVITGGDVVSVQLTGTTSALIKYSYGSVVRDLTIVLNQKPVLKRQDNSTTEDTTKPQTAPDTFFGGVIGCVLGGDNIIDNVAVTKGEKLNVSPSGDKPHLVPVGGYVGVIAGGGVIFRGEISNETGITSDSHLYRNPIIGRVLNGYAYYEGVEAAPNNTDQNYTINKITPPTPPADGETPEYDLNWDGSTLTVNSAQGLLLLSGIISSGAGNSSTSDAYTKGTVRHAQYDQIGKLVDGNAPADYSAASEATVPYLLNRYMKWSGTGSTPAALCTNSTDGIKIQFKTDGTAENSVPFDMGYSNDSGQSVRYNNGYRGLSARYVSNAAFGSKASPDANGVDPTGVVLRVESFDGKNATVSGINMEVKEYADDDFHAASLGGIFNIVWTEKSNGGSTTGTPSDRVFAQNLTLSDCKVSLRYYNQTLDQTLEEQKQANTTTFTDNDGLSCVAVGGFIGSVSDFDDISNGNLGHNYLFSDLHINGGTICGPNSAGGLVGASAMTTKSVTGSPGRLLSNAKDARFGSSFRNCSYSGITVTAKLAAGGLQGYVYANNSNAPQFSGFGLPYSNGSFKSFASCTVTNPDPNFQVGSDSIISAETKRGVAGGIFGGAGMRVGVNDPNVNANTGLKVVGAETDIQPVLLNKVRVYTSQKNELVSQSSGTTNGPTSDGCHDSAVGGVIGRIGNINPTYFYKVHLDQCQLSSYSDEVNEVKDSKANRFTGGIVGYGYTRANMTIQECEISNTDIQGRYSGGFVGYGHDYSSENACYILNLSDCKFDGGSIYGESGSGGLVGKASSKYFLFNLLIKNANITSNNSNNLGLLFGNLNGSPTISAVGISFYVSPDRTEITPPASYKGGTGTPTSGSYIVYADYTGMDDPVVDAKSPYIAWNPNFPISNATLTGDAVAFVDNDPHNLPIGAQIRVDPTALNQVSYQNYTLSNSEYWTNPANLFSTFYTEQETPEEERIGSDLPVLVLKGSETPVGVIEDYLNIITNGGYSKFKESHPSDGKFNLSVSVCTYDGENFTKNEGIDPTASLWLDNQGGLHVEPMAYDNARNRFTLVEASFTQPVNGQNRTYTVSIPVIVVRELQYDFMATFSYGTEFDADRFTQLKNHLLERTNTPFTAYLTYHYDSEKGKKTSYGWSEYLNGGGTMLIDKYLNFGSFPAGTQMTLLDCQNGNQAYRYTTNKDEEEVLLSQFKSVTNPDVSFMASMADILGVTCEASTNGKFVRTDDNPSAATVRLMESDGIHYYRPSSDGDADHYSLTVPDQSQRTALENYFLIITVPTFDGDSRGITGQLTSKLDTADIASHCNKVHRPDPETNETSEDNGVNTESTYQISSGYRQQLEVDKTQSSVDLSNPQTSSVKVRVQDTITFSNAQNYHDADALYLKLTASLYQYQQESSSDEPLQFPGGVNGTVNFYVWDENGNYYYWDSDQWKSQSGEKVATSYEWISSGRDMDLLLADENKHALNLADVRKAIKGTKDQGDSKIFVRAEMDVDFYNSPELLEPFPTSEDGIDAYAYLRYVGQISTQEYSLAYSTARVEERDNVAYYRKVSSQAILSLDARYINQLGVNPLALVPADLISLENGKASHIELAAALNLRNLPNYDAIIDQIDSVTFTLSLWQRSGADYEPAVDPETRIVFRNPTDTSKWMSPDANNKWSWRIEKGNGSFSGFFNGIQFSFDELNAYVLTNQKEFANYKIKLEVDCKDKNGNQVTLPLNDNEAYVVYTYACINPLFYDPSPAN